MSLTIARTGIAISSALDPNSPLQHA